MLGAAEHNLKGIDVDFPIGKFVAVTGVSGSGKSTLVNEIVYKALANQLSKTRTRPGAHEAVEGIDAFDKVIEIDQRPIGRTPRSNPATYTDLFTHIRELYSLTPDAKVRGYKPGRFSFNVKGGRCETCKGDGQIKIEMHFLPDVYVPCETCKGKRYNRETLEVRFKGKTIADVLEMSVEEALAFFSKIPKIRRRLQTLHDVGLDYMTLGQPATTLSGGEAQRVKLAAELCKVATGRTLYILDEPTTGLHFADIEKLLEMLQRLVDGGNTMLVIEHNLDVIKQADYLVDLGPEGGEAGGEIVAVGTPEEVAQVEGPTPAQFLRPLLERQAREDPRRRRVNWRTTGASVLLLVGVVCTLVFIAGIGAAWLNRNNTICSDRQAAGRPARPASSARSSYRCHNGQIVAPSQRARLMRDWWLRTLLVLQRPRPVFVACATTATPNRSATAPSRCSRSSCSRRSPRVLSTATRRRTCSTTTTTTGCSSRSGRSSPAASTARSATSRSARCSTRGVQGARLAGHLPPLAARARVRLPCRSRCRSSLWPVKLALYGERLVPQRRQRHGRRRRRLRPCSSSRSSPGRSCCS